MDKESKNIVGSFKKTIISDDLGKITENASEIIIDAILDEGLLKEIPLIGTTVSLFRIGKTIAAKRQIKKLWKFLYQLNEIPQDERAKFLARIEENQETKNELFERVLYIIERLDEVEKADILGRLFKNLVREKLSTTDFLRLTSIIDKTYLDDLTYLDIGYNRNCKVEKEEQYKFQQENRTSFMNENLTISGLLKKERVLDVARQASMGDKETRYITKFSLTSVGELLIRYGV